MDRVFVIFWNKFGRLILSEYAKRVFRRVQDSKASCSKGVCFIINNRLVSKRKFGEEFKKNLIRGEREYRREVFSPWLVVDFGNQRLFFDPT